MSRAAAARGRRTGTPAADALSIASCTATAARLAAPACSTDVDGLRNCVRLRRLDVSFNALPSLACLAAVRDCTDLTWLRVEGNPFVATGAAGGADAAGEVAGGGDSAGDDAHDGGSGSGNALVPLRDREAYIRVLLPSVQFLDRGDMPWESLFKPRSSAGSGAAAAPGAVAAAAGGDGAPASSGRPPRHRQVQHDGGVGGSPSAGGSAPVRTGAVAGDTPVNEQQRAAGVDTARSITPTTLVPTLASPQTPRSHRAQPAGGGLADDTVTDASLQLSFVSSASTVTADGGAYAADSHTQSGTPAARPASPPGVATGRAAAAAACGSTPPSTGRSASPAAASVTSFSGRSVATTVSDSGRSMVVVSSGAWLEQPAQVGVHAAAAHVTSAVGDGGSAASGASGRHFDDPDFDFSPWRSPASGRADALAAASPADGTDVLASHPVHRLHVAGAAALSPPQPLVRVVPRVRDAYGAASRLGGGSGGDGARHTPTATSVEHVRERPSSPAGAAGVAVGHLSPHVASSARDGLPDASTAPSALEATAAAAAAGAFVVPAVASSRQDHSPAAPAPMQQVPAVAAQSHAELGDEASRFAAVLAAHQRLLDLHGPPSGRLGSSASEAGGNLDARTGDASHDVEGGDSSSSRSSECSGSLEDSDSAASEDRPRHNRGQWRSFALEHHRSRRSSGEAGVDRASAPLGSASDGSHSSPYKDSDDGSHSHSFDGRARARHHAHRATSPRLITVRSRELRRLVADRDSYCLQLVDARSALQAARADNDTLRAECRTLKGQNRQFQAATAAMRREHAAEVDTLRQACAMAHDALARVQREAQQQLDQLQASVENAAAAEASRRQSIEHELSAARSQCAAASAECHRLQDSLGALEAGMAASVHAHVTSMTHRFSSFATLAASRISHLQAKVLLLSSRCVSLTQQRHAGEVCASALQAAVAAERDAWAEAVAATAERRASLAAAKARVELLQSLAGRASLQIIGSNHAMPAAADAGAGSRRRRLRRTARVSSSSSTSPTSSDGDSADDAHAAAARPSGSGDGAASTLLDDLAEARRLVVTLQTAADADVERHAAVLADVCAAVDSAIVGDGDSSYAAGAAPPPTEQSALQDSTVAASALAAIPDRAAVAASLALLSPSECHEYLVLAVLDALHLHARAQQALHAAASSSRSQAAVHEARLAALTQRLEAEASLRSAAEEAAAQLHARLAETDAAAAEQVRQLEASRTKQVSTAREAALRARAHAASLESQLQGVRSELAAAVTEIRRLEHEAVTRA